MTSKKRVQDDSYFFCHSEAAEESIDPSQGSG